MLSPEFWPEKHPVYFNESVPYMAHCVGFSADSRGNSVIIRIVGFTGGVSGSTSTTHRVGYRTTTINRMELDSMWLRAHNDCVS